MAALQNLRKHKGRLMKVLIQNRQKPTKINQQKVKRDSEALLRLLGLKDAELQPSAC